MINAMLNRYQECYTDLNNVLNVSKELKDKEREAKEVSNKQLGYDGTEFEDILNQEN